MVISDMKDNVYTLSKDQQVLESDLGSNSSSKIRCPWVAL